MGLAKYWQLHLHCKKAIRLIANEKYNAHTDPLFKKLNILKFKDLFELCHLKLYYKYSHHKLPSYFLEMISPMHVRQNRYNMRNMCVLQIHKVKHEYAKKCLRNNLPVVVNKTSENIKSKVATHSLQGFSWYIKKQFIEYYMDRCTIENCYICNN